MKHHAPFKAKITVIRGAESVSTHEFDDDPILIGRHPDNHITLQDAYISSWHGKIYRWGSDVLYEDLRSTNGSSIVRGADMIILDGRENTTGVLESGDQIYLGFTQQPLILEFECEHCLGANHAEDSGPQVILETLESTSPEGIPSDAPLDPDFFSACLSMWTELNSVLKLTGAISVLARTLFSVFNKATHTVILLREGRRPKYVPAYSIRRAGDQYFEEKAQIAKDVLTQVLNTGDAVRLETGISAPLWTYEGLHGVVFVENRDTAGLFTTDDLRKLILLARQASAVIERIKDTNKRIKGNAEQTMKCLVAALEAKDKYTHGHSEQVALFCRLIAEGMGLTSEEANLIFRASLLHDIGKIGVSYAILNKKGRLTIEEYEEVKRHPLVGMQIIEPIETLRDLLPIVLYHHERYDGKGYPRGKKGRSIPLGARILAVADTYHAMTSDRPYRKALSHEAAVQELIDNAGSQFDPKVVEVFVREMTRILSREQVKGTADVTLTDPPEYIPREHGETGAEESVSRLLRLGPMC